MSDMRRRAEERVATMREADLNAMTPAQGELLLHELHVHQVELEMQNEELRQAQVALETARARYFDLYEMAPVGYITFGEQNMILEANLRAVTMLGFVRGDLVRQSFTRFINPDDQDVFYLHRKKLFETGEAQSCELRMKRPDDGEFWARLDMTRTTDETTGDPGRSGPPRRACPWPPATLSPSVGVVCRVTLSDITELKNFERTLQEINIELKTATRMKSEFIANMSHELRTPLNAVIGFSEALKDNLIGEITEEQRQYINEIFASGKHLLSLINDILDLSKVEAGAMELDLEPTQMSLLLVNSLSIIRERAAARRIRLSMDCAEELGFIRADQRKVKQIVYNLLSNAVKFSNEGGQVTLHAARVSRSAVGSSSGDWSGARCFPLAGNAFEEFIRISVTDSGIGIPPEGLELLFKPFSQIDSKLARKYEGTGLGLMMVKLFVELHGGTVAVESTVAKGTRFTAWLPYRAPEETALLPDRDGAA